MNTRKCAGWILALGSLIAVLAGCNLRQDTPAEPQQAVRLGRQVKIYQAGDLAQLKYTSLGPIDDSACKFEWWDDTPTEQGVTEQLLLRADSMGANGILTYRAKTALDQRW